MDTIWSQNSLYHRVEYNSENELEAAIIEVQTELFGLNRIYLDVKRKIGTKGGLRNVPDGYLIDLSGHTPRLYVVENELASHDPLRHIAVQILEFSLSFEAEPHGVKTILFSALQNQPKAKLRCENYATSHNFRNLDHMLEWMVFESPFAALVIIDEMPDKLESVLTQRFKFGVEPLELALYKNTSGEHLYRFEPFLADIGINSEGLTPVDVTDIGSPDIGELDTVVVPAREEGFQDTFLRENRWHAVRLHGTIRPQIKYIAVYRIRPIQAITHIAPVSSIESWGDAGKFVINFSEPAQEITPIPMARGGRIKSFQNLRYTTLEKLKAAKNLDEVW